MRKFCFVMPWHISERGGGAEVQASLLAEELVNRGEEVFYICQTRQTTRINSCDNVNGVQVYWLKHHGMLSWMFLFKYTRTLQEINPDIVVQRVSTDTTFVLGRYSKRTGSKFIWICTDDRAPRKDLHREVTRVRIVNNGMIFSKRIVLKINATIKDFLRNLGMAYVDLAFTQNNNQFNTLINEFGIKSERMISGHKTPDLRRSVEERFAHKRILWCGNFGVRKRPELFIELAYRLKGLGITSVMVGGSTTEIEKYQDCKDFILFIPKVSFQDSLEFFDEATLFVNTSNCHGDGFPNTYIQSWLRGVPVLSFGFDPDDVIKEKRLGFIADSIEHAKLQIASLFADYDEYVSLSQNVVDYSLENHTVEIMANNFIKKLGDI